MRYRRVALSSAEHCKPSSGFSRSIFSTPTQCLVSQNLTTRVIHSKHVPLGVLGGRRVSRLDRLHPCPRDNVSSRRYRCRPAVGVVVLLSPLPSRLLPSPLLSARRDAITASFGDGYAPLFSISATRSSAHDIDDVRCFGKLLLSLLARHDPVATASLTTVPSV